jgi:hypothetical protein
MSKRAHGSQGFIHILVECGVPSRLGAVARRMGMREKDEPCERSGDR